MYNTEEMNIRCPQRSPYVLQFSEQNQFSKCLNNISRRIGHSQMDLGIELGFDVEEIQTIQQDFVSNIAGATMTILTVRDF